MRNSLALRISIYLTITSFAIAFIASEIFYRQSYAAAIAQSNSEINTLVDAVSPTASIGAFVEDAELVKEVLNGLLQSKKITAAAFKSDKIKEFKNTNMVGDQTPRIFVVKNPFIQDETLAQLLVYPNLKYIEQQAEDLSRLVTTALYVLALAVTATSIIICHFVVTRPITKVGRSLHEVMPGSEHQIPVPSRQHKTEIGSLVADANQLLSRIYHQFKEERRLRKEIEKLEQQFRLLFENATSPIVLIDQKGELIISNKSFKELLQNIGFNSKAKLGYLLNNLIEIPKTMDMAVHEAIKHNEILSSELQVKSFSDNKERWVQFVLSPFESDSEEIYFHITLNDITRRKREISNLAKQADFDSLTKVLNRNGGEKVLRNLTKEQTSFALILIDLNGFKLINDTYGHDAGDVVLVKTAETLSEQIRKQDHVVRWGGDEFILILQIDEIKAVKRVMKKLAKHVVRDYQFANNPSPAKISMSAGVAMYPKDAVDLHGLIRLADEAMYTAKQYKHTDPSRYLIFANELLKKDSNQSTTV